MMEKETSLGEALCRTIQHDLEVMQRLYSSVASDTPENDKSSTSIAIPGYASPRKSAEVLPTIRAAYTKAYDSIKQINGPNSSIAAADALLYHLSTNALSHPMGRLLSDVHTLLVSVDRLLSVQPWPSTSVFQFSIASQNALRFASRYLQSSWSWPIGSERRRFLCNWTAALWNRLSHVSEKCKAHSSKGIIPPTTHANGVMHIQTWFNLETTLGGDTTNDKDAFSSRLRDLKTEATDWISALIAEVDAARTVTDFFVTDQLDKPITNASALLGSRRPSDQEEEHLPASPVLSVVSLDVKTQKMKDPLSCNATFDERNTRASSPERNSVAMRSGEKADAEDDREVASLREEGCNRDHQGERLKKRQTAADPLKEESIANKHHRLARSLTAEAPDEEDTERFLFQAAEVMRETAQRYGQVLAQDKKILEATAEAAGDQFTMTHAAVQTIRVFSWGQKMSFFQEMLLFIGSGVLFCVMISFILLSTPLA